MKTCIVMAHHQEVDCFLQSCQDSRRIPTGHGALYHVLLNGTETYLLKTGIGLENARKGLLNAHKSYQLAACTYKPVLFVNCGPAGAMYSSRRIGDLVVGTHTLHDLSGISAKRLNNEWTQKIADYLFANSIPYVYGKIYTAPNALVSGDLRDTIYHATGAEVVDMESFGLAEAAEDIGFPLIALKCVTDNADENAPDDYSRNRNKAMTYLSEVLCRFILDISHTNKLCEKS